MDSLPQEENDLVKLFQNIVNLDRVELLVNIARLSVNYVPEWDTEKLRLLLKQAVIEEILKTDCDKIFYGTCLDETKVAINNWGNVETGYPCCILGCRFIGDRHRNYVLHLKKNHLNLKHVLCNFMRTCRRNFSSIDSLIKHVKETHSSNRAEYNVNIPSTSSSSVINIPCKCDLCSGRNFENIKELMMHFNTFHFQQWRQCIFLGCDVSFGSGSTSRHHFRLKHKYTGDMQLKRRHLVSSDQGTAQIDVGSLQSISTPSHGEHPPEPTDEYDADELDLLENDEDELEELDEEYFLDYYSDFMNRLSNFKFIPQSTVQDIASEYISNTRKSLESRKVSLKKSLNSLTGISQEEKDKIIEDLENDTFLNAQVQLGTEYKRLKYVKENKNYVAPEEITLNKEEVRLGAKKDVYHYIPLVSSIKTLLQDDSFNKMIALNNRAPQDDKIVDLKDGSVYKSSTFFQGSPDAFSILLYSDAVELKGLHNDKCSKNLEISGEG